jgi:hypothetical protein
VLIRIFQHEGGGWRKIQNEVLHNFYHILFSMYITKVLKTRRMRHDIKPEGDLLGRPRNRLEDHEEISVKGPIHDQSCCATLRVVQHD